LEIANKQLGLNRDPDRWIIVAKLIRPHGFPREGVFRYRAQFDVRGSESLVSAKTVGLSLLGFDDRIAENKILIQKNQVSFVSVALAKDVAPMGGKWGVADGAILSFKESEIPAGEPKHKEKEWVGRLVALQRKDFPRINDSEVYLCDLLGFEVRVAADSPPVGKVHAYAQVGKSNLFNIIVKVPKGEDFEFPMKWIDWEVSSHEKSFLVVPSVQEWQNL